MDILLGRSIGLVTGFTHVGKFLVVVELPGSYMEEGMTFFDEKCRERSLTEQWINSRPVYHVVNGGYEHEARWRLSSENGWQFGGLKWSVLPIPWRGTDEVRSIATMSNELQKKGFFIAITFMEELILIRRTIENLISRGEFVCAPGKPLPRGLPEKVANAFSGRNEFTNSTIKVLIGVAAKTTLETIQAMSEILDMEVPVVAKKLNKCTPDALLKNIRNEFIHPQGAFGATRVGQYEKLLFRGNALDSSVETGSGRTSNENQDREGGGACEENLKD